MIRRAVALAALLPAAAAVGAQRTFVASNGDDGFACSLAAPCRSFAAAMAHTDANGEIVVLDSAGYGRVAVDKSLTIAAPPGVYAGLAVFAGANGVDIATPGVTVVLRGLTINGQGGMHGVAFSAGARLVIESCVVANMIGNGLSVSAAGATVTVSDTTLRNNGANGIAVTASGTKVGLDNVRAEANGQAGLVVDNGASAAVSRSRLDGNVNGVDVLASDGGSTSVLSLSDSVAADNANRGVNAFAAAPNAAVRAFLTSITLSGNASAGVAADAGAGGKAVVSLTSSTVSGNGNGVVAANGSNPGDVTLAITASSVSRNAGAGLAQSGNAVLKTRGDNTVHGNNPDQTGTLTPLPPV